jgi:hypothetical protein
VDRLGREEMTMRLGAMTVAGVVAIAAATAAAASIWLALTDPEAVAVTVSERDLGPVARALGDALWTLWRAILRYL